MRPSRLTPPVRCAIMLDVAENADDTANIAEAILSARASRIERLLQTVEGRDIARLDATYVALTGQSPPPWSEAGGNPPTAAATDRSESKVKLNGSASPSRKPSLRAQVLDLLEEAPIRWTHDEMADELERRGTELTGSGGDRKSSLRTAVWTLAKRGDASRAEGAFWAAKYDAQLQPQHQDEELIEEEVFDDGPSSDIDPHQIARLSGEEI